MNTHEKLKALTPEMRRKVSAIIDDLKGKGWQPMVAEGRRTWEQQKEKVRLGYSKTMHSKHLVGDAADIVDERYGWGKGGTKLFWLHVGSSAIAHGLRWGGSFGLDPHEWTDLRTALVKGDFDKAESLKVGWDTAHVEMVR